MSRGRAFIELFRSVLAKLGPPICNAASSDKSLCGQHAVGTLVSVLSEVKIDYEATIEQ